MLVGRSPFIFFHCTTQESAALKISRKLEVLRKTSPLFRRGSSQNVGDFEVSAKASALVVLELEVEAASRVKGVEVMRPAVSSSPPTLLALWVQGVLTRVKLLPHFWKRMHEKNVRQLKINYCLT